jgi:hypothetical protein
MPNEMLVQRFKNSPCYDFLGNHFGYDVSINKNIVVARWGPKPGQYHICCLEMLEVHLSDTTLTSLMELKEYHYLAMIVALGHLKMKELNEQLPT